MASEGEKWYWWYGLDPKTVGNNVTSHGTRLIDLSSYVVNGTRKYAAVELGDDNPSQPPVNAESARVQSYADQNGWAGSYHGAYFVSSAPGAAPVVAANSDFHFQRPVRSRSCTCCTRCGRGFRWPTRSPLLDRLEHT